LEFIDHNFFHQLFYCKLYSLIIIYFRREKRPYLIEVNISGSEGERGPSKFIKGIKDILPYYSYGNCFFVSSNGINPINGKNKSDFFFLPYSRFSNFIYNEWVNIGKVNRLILGPIFVPNLWRIFPNKRIWYEERFPEILQSVKGIGVHSTRVRDYLAKRSNTTDMISKFIIIKPCTNLAPKKVKPFNKRSIDILLFEKYADLNRRPQANKLYNFFRNSSKNIIKLKYGKYNKNLMIKLANNAKFIIYFSFYDTGAIGLKEIQNYGVIAFTHQKEFVISNATSFFVPELADKDNIEPAYKIILNIINNVISSFPNTRKIARKNQEINRCKNALDDICQSVSNYH
jgi:hypothetical protein